MQSPALDVVVIGGGMITHDLLLPSLYHLQRVGSVAAIHVCALNSAPLRALAESSELQQAFPGQAFTPHPPLTEAPERCFPELYGEVLRAMQPRQMVVVAVPDPLHYAAVMAALRRDQHVLCVKPLVLKHAQAVEIAHTARERGLFVGVEYHKRCDRRALLARRNYREGRFGEFAMGEAKMIEPWYYRQSNFQNWFTCGNTDPFVYVGCHYVDLVYFITGLRPVAVSVQGVKGRFPNGNEGYLWANGRVRFENGALLSVTDGLGYPDEAAGSNEQCLEMFCEGPGRTGLILHDDQFRGVAHSYVNPPEGPKAYRYINPDFFRLVPWEGPGWKPVGYGYDSVALLVETARRIEGQTAGLAPAAARQRRRELLAEVDAQGLIATPANSAINELVIEAARLSIEHDGDVVAIQYEPTPGVQRRQDAGRR